MNNETVTLSNGSSAAVYYPPTQPAAKFILYFHGGGFVYGSKNDLTKKLKQVFLNNGYTVLAVDYLLAPNSSLAEIIKSTEETLQELRQRLIKDQPFGFCGRSAGGYLMMMLTKRLLSANEPLPDFLVNFYGYTDLDFIQTERLLFDKQITKAEIESIDQTTPVWDDPLFNRFLLYIYAVQHQLLEKFYGTAGTAEKDFSISDKELEQFPRMFSSASTADQEIPFRYSKAAARKNSEGCFVPLYYLEHDFLKNTSDNQVMELMKKLDDWLKE